MKTILLQKTESVEDQPSQLIFTRSQAVVSRRVAGETLIVPVRGKVGDLGSIYSFNETGSLIWQSLETPKGLSELISAVEQEYAVGQEQAERDVTQFLDDSRGLPGSCDGGNGFGVASRIAVGGRALIVEKLSSVR